MLGGLAVAVVVVVRRPPPDAVVLLGDSIAEEAAPYLEDEVDGAPVVDRHHGGTAPCDWSADDIPAGQGDLVVVSFSGNSLTDCMSDGAGGFLQGAALVDRYARDLRALVDGIRDRGAQVILVGQPARRPDADGAGNVPRLNHLYEALAEGEGVSYVDAGAALETDDGAFAADLPCLPDEPQCAPSGRNPVRHPDGVHLCPVPSEGGCSVHSSGALRFARAIADAIAWR